MIFKKKLSIKSYLYSYNVNFNFRINNLGKKKYKNAFYLIDKQVFKKYKLQKFISNKRLLLIESNEKSKSFEKLNKVFNFLFKKNIQRKNLIIAIGGGIVQDIAGFVSSVILRGVEWKFIPTTILSQCDSCIGGKTSINFSGIKNKIGNFYPPKEIYITTDFIKSLGQKELRSGVGEMAHYYFVKDKKNFEIFNKNFREAIDKNMQVLEKLIYNTLLIKKKFIEKDEFDKGKRLILNYGHTFGHAIEKITDYKMPHGVAVAHGMNMANFVSWKKNFISDYEFLEFSKILREIYSTFKIKKIRIPEFIEILKKDKKNINNKIHLILTKGIGKMFIYKVNDIRFLKNTLIQYCEYFNIKK